MQLKIFLSFLIVFLTLSAKGQQIQIDNFTIAKHAVKQKSVALLDLYTTEKDLTFSVNDMPVSANEGDGYMTLTLPHKATSLLIQHPQYGQLNWKIPGKGLKKKKHYRADLIIQSLEKDFRNSKQWVVFHLSPKRCIAKMDSTTYLVRDGRLSLYLPVGEHVFQMEAPFYESLSDTLIVSDSLRLEKQYQLEPHYAYLEVKAPHQQCQILLDQELIGKGEAETGRIAPGSYHLIVKDEGHRYVDEWIELQNAEKRCFVAGNTPLPNAATPQAKTEATTADAISFETDDDFLNAPALSLVTIKAFNEETGIWLNREYIGKGSWQGELSPGFYAVSSEKDELTSRTSFFWVKAGRDLTINLMAPMADYGMVNVMCDEPQAKVYHNGILVDETPCVLMNLPLHSSHHIKVVKGNKMQEKFIELKGNDIVNVNFKLKK